MKMCPQCSSGNVTHYMGANFGKWKCKDCDYVGPLVLDDSESDSEDSEVLKAAGCCGGEKCCGNC